jgi:hypothetical protein
MEKKLLAIIMLVMVGLLSIAGCTSSSNTTTATPTATPSQSSTSSTAAPAVTQVSQAHAYAQAYQTATEKNKGPNDSLTFSIVDNGNDTAILTITDVNTTPNALFSNGMTMTETFNIKQFASTSEATTFFNSATSGYTRNDSAGIDPYRALTGHTATINAAAVKLNSISGTVNMSFALQQDNFVTYGTITEAQL